MSKKLKQEYRDKLHWLEMGIPFSESENNPNTMVFSLAMEWENVLPLLERWEKDQACIVDLKDELADESLQLAEAEDITIPYLEDRITELEAMNKNQAEQIDDDVQRITELENTPDYLASRITKLEAQLEAVKPLPDKWRHADRIGDEVDAVMEIADELDAVLEQRDE